MQVLISRQIKPGEYAELGMNDRTIIGPWRSEKHIRKLAEQFARGKGARLEWFADGTISYAEPYRTDYI
jgi:hypothetical protein